MGFGGFFTFPFSMTIEVAMTIERQIRMVELISRIYANQVRDPLPIRVKAQALVLGSGHIGSLVQVLFIRMIPKIVLG